MFKEFVSSSEKNPLEVKIPLEPSRVSITLIYTRNWEKKYRVLQKVKQTCSFMKSGQLFTCVERFGGNTLSLLYPYLHITKERYVLKERIRDAIALERSLPIHIEATLSQASYLEMDTFSKDNSNYSLASSQHLMFMGMRISDNDDASVIESSWRKWSKVGLLAESLARSGVVVEGISFLKQTSPKNINLFMYCFVVGIKLCSKEEKLQCLSVLQRVRGTIIPGYLSLFQQFRGHLKEESGQRRMRTKSQSVDSLDMLISEMGEVLTERELLDDGYDSSGDKNSTGYHTRRSFTVSK